jgi:CubicO group peptidase (beta-lactamase class C family)
MILGEVLSRGQSDHLSVWAERNLFSLIGMEAEWWTDNSQSRGGNVLSYCCIDAKPRDFARLGQLLLNRGAYGGRQVISQSYIDSIIEASSQQQAFYFAQFWFAETQSGQRFIVALGFDGQMMAVDVEHQIVVVRSSLYQPFLNATGERSMILKPNETQQSNWVGSLPQGMGVSYYAEHDFRKFLDLVSEAVVN